MVLMIVLGLTATWCGVGVNLPILSQIVQEDRRATIMAWEGTLESSCSAIFGNAAVGFLAQNVFGYDLDAARSDIQEDQSENTKALGTALMMVSFFPWLLCFVCYTLLHWSYPRDLKWLRESGAAASGPRVLEDLRVDEASREKGGQAGPPEATSDDPATSEKGDAAGAIEDAAAAARASD
uniref:Uncharacterized protein n=1 Tax=Zooxanthella nutricula TaxID=1333877 RepID=A0A7S2IM62_9DINO